MDDDAPVFQCQVCKSDFTNPYVSLDRNTQQHGTDVWQGKVRKTIKIWLSQEMFRYDSQHCWSLHAPEIEAALQLKATYPPSGPVTPCCRCGIPVERSLPHISYAMTEMAMEYGAGDWIGHVLKDREFALLCRECEAPDEFEVAAEAEVDSPVPAQVQNQNERSMA